jgi:predicted RNase H-like HicB family nuclease
LEKRPFTVVIEQDDDGFYIGSVPELPGCHTQARSLDELQERIVEAIELYLEENKGALESVAKFVGIQRVEVVFEGT